MFSVERLQHKISPLEDKAFTAKILPLLQVTDLGQFARTYKGVPSLVATPQEMWGVLFPDEVANLRELTTMGRSLAALMWERSYLRGNLIFTKPVSEYEEDGF